MDGSVLRGLVPGHSRITRIGTMGRRRLRPHPLGTNRRHHRAKYCEEGQGRQRTAGQEERRGTHHMNKLVWPVEGN